MKSLREVHLFIDATVVMLSERMMIRLFAQNGAQRWAATTTARTSFSLI